MEFIEWSRVSGLSACPLCLQAPNSPSEYFHYPLRLTAIALYLSSALLSSCPQIEYFACPDGSKELRSATRYA